MGRRPLLDYAMVKPGSYFLALAVFLAGAPLQASTPGGVASGGGVRGNGPIQVRDVIGLPAVGTAAGAQVVVQSGAIPGLPAVTPVSLTAFSLAVLAEGVELGWEGNSDRRILEFTVERAEGAVLDPDGFQPLPGRFEGPGPHVFLDESVVARTVYHYRLRAVDATGASELLGPWRVEVEATPRSFPRAVLPASPNPFREAFALSFTLSEPTPVAWTLHDVRGRLLARDDLGLVEAGLHTRTVRPAEPLPAGIYFLNVVVGPSRDVQKVVSLP